MVHLTAPWMALWIRSRVQLTPLVRRLLEIVVTVSTILDTYHQLVVLLHIPNARALKHLFELGYVKRCVRMVANSKYPVEPLEFSFFM